MSRWTKAVVFLAGPVPLAVLIWRRYHHELGANWIEAAQHFTGDWILWFLIATLLVTPVRRLPGLGALIRYRRMFGLYAFFYACVHLSIYLWYDKGLDWLEIKGDFLKRRFYIMGLIAFTLLIPLAITSTKGWIRRLGGRRWQYLHWLIYPAALSGAVHYYWQGKGIVPRAVDYAIVFILLVLYRPLYALWRVVREKRRTLPSVTSR
jgi:sulfoxide reductase heme-binding subunit YedZ